MTYKQIRVRYNKHNQYRFDVFVKWGDGWKFFRTCDVRTAYLKELGFENPEINAYIEMRILKCV